MSYAGHCSKLALTSHLALLVCTFLIIGCGGGNGASTSAPQNPQQQPLVPTVSISSDKSNIIAGDTATLSWTSTNATAIAIDGIGTVAATGSLAVQPKADTTYTITATGSGGTATAAVTIKVSDTRSPVKHVIVVVMQNRSFDHLFGQFPGAHAPTSTDPGFTQNDAAGTPQQPFLLTQLNRIDLAHAHANFVKMVDGGKMDQFALVNGAVAMGYYDRSTPGIGPLWDLAQQFALADNFFASVLGDAPTNQLYLVAASDNEFPFGVEPFFPPCNEPDPAAKAFTFPNLADQLSAKNLGWAWFAEDLGTCTTYHENQNAFQYFTSTHASNGINGIQDFSQFSVRLANGSLPPVSFIQPTDPHAMHPSSSQDVGAGVQWLTTLVQNIQGSSVWPEAAIVVVWDSSGGWYDHVPPATADSQGLGPRVPMLVISPLGKSNYISHVPMDDVSILRFIQWNWGLPSLNPRNDATASGDLRDMFAF